MVEHAGHHGCRPRLPCSAADRETYLRISLAGRTASRSDPALQCAELGSGSGKIGVQGFSAGGHLALLTALSSQTQAYEPLDELDSVPCHVNFALPVYPAYVLDDGAAGPNQRKGNDAELAPGLNFDARSCPMCLLHGDRDIYSPMGAVRIYAELRKKGIPCELHIFADAVHGFMFWNDAPNTQSWRARGLEWMKVMGYVP